MNESIVPAELNLSSDLEWMLQSGQASQAALIECLTRETFASIYYLAQIILGKSRLAQQCAIETLASAVTSLHEYRAEYGAVQWLFAIALKHCHRIAKEARSSRRRQTPLPQESEREQPLPQMVGPENTAWLEAFDRMAEDQRIILTLHLVYQWPIARISQTIKQPAAFVAAQLQATLLFLFLYLRKLPQDPKYKHLEDRLADVLRNRWPKWVLEGDKVETLIEEVHQQVESLQPKRKRILLSKELALGGATVVLAVLFGLGSGLFDESSPPPSAIPPLAAQLAEVVVTFTPAPTLGSRVTPTATAIPTMTATTTAISNVIIPLNEALFSTLLPRPEDPTGVKGSGPLSLAFVLDYLGWQGKPDMPLQELQPSTLDETVLAYEIENFVAHHTDYRFIQRFGGNPDLLKRLIEAGYAVIVQQGIEDNDSLTRVFALSVTTPMPPFSAEISSTIPTLPTSIPAESPDRSNRWAVTTPITTVAAWSGWTATYEVVIGLSKDSLQIIVWRPSGVRSLSRFEFLEGWRAFNYGYIVIYPPEKEEALFQLLGDQADTQKNYQMAAERASQMIFSAANSGDLFYAWFNRATSLAYLDDYQGAAAAYDQAFAILAALPSETRPWRMMWYNTRPYWAYYYTGRYQEVVNLATETINSPGGALLEESFYWRALAREALGDLSSALEDAAKTIELNPNFAPGLTLYERLKP